MHILNLVPQNGSHSTSLPTHQAHENKVEKTVQETQFVKEIAGRWRAEVLTLSDQIQMLLVTLSPEPTWPLSIQNLTGN